MDLTAFHHAHDWSFPVPIAYGPGRVADIGAIAGAAGMAHPLVVTDRASAALPFVGRVSDGFDRAAVFADISPNPRDDEIAAGKAAYLAGGHDGIIAVGGGSGMDGGKAIALTALNGIDLWAFEFEKPSPPAHRFPPLICVPTTAGTGAETESTAMITDTARGMKFCIWHRACKPACALLDPDLTLALPRDLTAWTGIDALTHAVEAYCVPGLHPLCDGAALEALRLIPGALPRVLDAPDDVAARGAMLVASCLAGVAFQKGLGLVHAISHMIGAEYDTHHGLTNAVLLPPVLRFNAPVIGDRVAPMAAAMGVPGPRFEDLYGAICQLLDGAGIPSGLTTLGVPDTCAERIAEKALEDSAAGTNPRQATARDIAAIVRAAAVRGR